MAGMQAEEIAVPEPTSVSATRARLERLLVEQAWPGDVDATLIAVHEALINADRHGRGIREVAARIAGARLVVEVADCGDGFDPTPYAAHEPDLLAERGRGLWLMHQVAERVDVHQEREGARLVLGFSIRATSSAAPTVAPRRLPTIAESGDDLAAALGAGVLMVDEELVVRQATPQFARLFALDTEAVTGRDARGVVAELKHRFQDPLAYEDRILRAFAHWTEPGDDLFVMADRRLVRWHTRPLSASDGHVVAQLTAYVPVTEQTEMVAQMQRALLPRLPQWGELDVGGIYHPAEVSAFVGGDFYDFIELSEGGRCVLVGDVSGHGPEAAASSMQVRAYLRAALATQGVTSAVPSLDAAVQQAFAPEEFVTLALVVQESQDVWTLTNCGHVPALVLRGGEVTELGARGALLGMGLADQWVREPFLLSPGDVLLLYTDGVLDAGRGQQRFGLARLMEALVDLGELPAQQLVESIDARVHAFSANQANDDHVLLAVRRLRRR